MIVVGAPGRNDFAGVSSHDMPDVHNVGFCRTGSDDDVPGVVWNGFSSSVTGSFFFLRFLGCLSPLLPHPFGMSLAANFVSLVAFFGDFKCQARGGRKRMRMRMEFRLRTFIP